MIRVGIIGCGKIAQVRHIPDLAANSSCELAGYYNPTRSRAEDMAAQYGGTVFGSVEELFADETIDAVVICTANCSHAAYSMMAMRAGKHVLCEKPMAATVEECEEMVRVSKETGMKLMIAMNQRFESAHLIAKEIMDSGDLGDVLSFRTTFAHAGPEGWSIHPGKDTWFFDKERAGMGVIADLGVHKIDLIHYLTGKRITEVTAVVDTLEKTDETGNPIPVDDNAVCLCRLEGGAVGTVQASWTNHGEEDNSTVIYGTNGTLKILLDGSTIALEGAEGNERWSCRWEYAGAANEFIDCILQDREVPITGEDGLSAMRVVCAALESSRTGKRITISQ